MVLFIIMWPFYATFSDFRFEIWAILCIVATNVHYFQISDLKPEMVSNFKFEVCSIYTLCANKWCIFSNFRRLKPEMVSGFKFWNLLSFTSIIYSSFIQMYFISSNSNSFSSHSILKETSKKHSHDFYVYCAYRI